jgi:hypothetical protein
MARSPDRVMGPTEGLQSRSGPKRRPPVDTVRCAMRETRLQQVKVSAEGGDLRAGGCAGRETGPQQVTVSAERGDVRSAVDVASVAVESRPPLWGSGKGDDGYPGLAIAQPGLL